MNPVQENTPDEIAEKTARDKTAIIEELKQTPVVQVAVKRAGASRASYYRWRKEDPAFKKASDEAMAEGELLINDISESMVITLIKEKKWNALRFWLEHHHPRYAKRISIEGNIATREEFTPEQKAIFEQALRFVSLPSEFVEAQINEIYHDRKRPIQLGPHQRILAKNNRRPRFA